MFESANLCSSTDLQEKIESDHLKLLDCSWYLPSQNVDSKLEFNAQHIPGAAFFDLDLICDQEDPLPHMMPNAKDFAAAVGNLGISNVDAVVVYDSAGIFSAARVWWMFRVFGHQDVWVLNGGLPAWIESGGTTCRHNPSPTVAQFDCELEDLRIIANHQLKREIESQTCKVLDARSLERFNGTAPEPRAGLRSGHMPGSLSLPFDMLLDQGHLRGSKDLRSIFTKLGLQPSDPIVTTCGSGVTAAIITLALAVAGYGMQRLYDGSWAEWASSGDTEILTTKVN